MSINNHMRQKQKLVYWIVIILVVPSFILVWGGGSFFSARSLSGGPTVFKFRGRDVNYNEFRDFRRRMAAVMPAGDINFYVAGLMHNVKADSADEQRNIVNRRKYMLLYCLIKEAEDAGIKISDYEVGTYLSQMFDKDPQVRRKKIADHCQRIGITVPQFSKGCYELMTIGKYVSAMDSFTPASPEVGYVNYAESKAEYTYKSQTVTITEKMRAEVRKKHFGEDDKGNPDEKKMAEVLTKYLAAHKDSKRYWTKPKWRLEYVLVPYDAIEIGDIDKAVLFDYYNKFKSSYDKGFAESVEKVKQDYIKTKRKEQAKLIISGPLENHIQGCLIENKPVTLESIQADQELAKNKVIVGDTGDKLLTVVELVQDKNIGDSDLLAVLLGDLSAVADNPSASGDKKAKFEKLQKQFDTEQEVLSCKKGLFRIRIKAFKAGDPRTLIDAKGSVDMALMGLLSDDFIYEKVREEAKAQAEKIGLQMQSGDFKGLTGLKEETLKYDELRYGPKADIIESDLGKSIVVPVYGGTKISGYEAVVLTRRAVPSRESYERLSDTEQKRYSMSGVFEKMGGMRGFQLKPGLALRKWCNDAFVNGLIQVVELPKEKTKK